MFSVESEACRNLSAHIGARTVTTALLALFSAICLAVLSSIHPPQLKPMTAVARKPATAPCKRRVSDSPCRIEGNSMVFPFARHRFGARAAETRMGSGRAIELKTWSHGIAPTWFYYALIIERSLYKFAHSPWPPKTCCQGKPEGRNIGRQ